MFGLSGEISVGGGGGSKVEFGLPQPALHGHQGGARPPLQTAP